MNLQSTMTLLLIAAIIASSTGCASIAVKQAWSSNFALADGTTANDPAIIDGNVATLGQSQYVEATGDAIMGMGAQSEAVILLPEPKSIHRVVIRSPNLRAFDIWINDAQGRWEKIKEVESNKKPVIDLRLNRTVYTSGIKVRVRRTSDDAQQRRKNVRNVRGWMVYSGNTNAPAKIAEIELYGFVSEPDGTSSTVTQSSDSSKAEEEIDEIDLFLK